MMKPESCERDGKSQKRRIRMRKSAILKSKLASYGLISQLGCGKCMSGSSCCRHVKNPSFLEVRLEVIEQKLDSLLLSLAPPALLHYQTDNVYHAASTLRDASAT